MITLEKLEALKLCLDTGDMSFFHGDASEAFKEVVDELYEHKQHLGDFDDTEELSKECSRLAEEKEAFLESVVETIPACTATYHPHTDRYKLMSDGYSMVLSELESDEMLHLDGEKYEVIIRVVE